MPKMSPPGLPGTEGYPGRGRHGLSVLNTDRPSEEAARAWRAARAGHLQIEGVYPYDYKLAEDLRGWSILTVARIIHKVGGKSGEFDGWCIGEEFHSRPHPLLLLPPGKVSRTFGPGRRQATSITLPSLGFPGTAALVPGHAADGGGGLIQRHLGLRQRQRVGARLGGRSRRSL
jgi:hypothetical protein